MDRTDELDSLKVTVLAEDSVLYESPYLGQHGISLLLEGTRGEDTKRILVDVGQNSQALLQNMKLMDISPASIDAIVLTHCHYDHTQGVANMLREMGRTGVTVVAHSDIFRPHFITEPYLRHVGIMPGDSREEMEKAGGRIFLSKDPFTLMPGIMTTGEVSRETDFEDVGVALKTIKNGKTEEDLMLDDISVIARIKEKGLVIITGCSHAGIVNIARHSMKLTGCDRIEEIAGGLHLIDAPETRIKRTVEELARLEPAWIYAGHCTGFRAQVELYLAFKEHFAPLHTGMQFVA
ncbi:MAG: MBL fold metallo-hydrolase [Dehalococcoidia bacterium]|nr:MBL fold metallo-hydrolase [Dehalococcoidia bacterium]